MTTSRYCPRCERDTVIDGWIVVFPDVPTDRGGSVDIVRHKACGRVLALVLVAVG